MDYKNLSADDKRGIEVALLHVTTGVANDKLLRALEADHYARTLLGLPTAAQEARMSNVRAGRRPDAPVTPAPGGPPRGPAAQAGQK